MSMRDAAAVIDGDKLVFEARYEGWDADMFHGCVCDDGWGGYDCSLRYDGWRLEGGQDDDSSSLVSDCPRAPAFSL